MKTVNLLPLRRYEHPDLSNYVIHFVDRMGRPNDRVPPEIAAMNGPARLAQIFDAGEIRAFPVFFSGEDPVVCFTECTPAGVRTLIRERRYTPWGIAFSKDVIFGAGGGPAFCVRGDEWHLVEDASFPPALRARCTKLWPGADLGEGLTSILADQRLKTPSEWTHEREWRVIGDGEPAAFRFRLEDVAFAVVGSKIDGPVPTVHIDPITASVTDEAGVWLPKTEPDAAASA